MNKGISLFILHKLFGNGNNDCHGKNSVCCLNIEPAVIAFKSLADVLQTDTEMSFFCGSQSIALLVYPAVRVANIDRDEVHLLNDTEFDDLIIDLSTGFNRIVKEIAENRCHINGRNEIKAYFLNIQPYLNAEPFCLVDLIVHDHGKHLVVVLKTRIKAVQLIIQRLLIVSSSVRAVFDQRIKAADMLSHIMDDTE